MLTFDALQIISCAAGILTALLVAAFRRIGTASWPLALFLIPSSLSAGALASPWLITMDADAALRLSFTILVATSPIGILLSILVGKEEPGQLLRARRGLLISIFLLLPFVAVWIYSYSPPADLELQEGIRALGPGGYFGALYMALLAIFSIASLEQTLRSAQERARWELKFLLLGLAVIFGAQIYISSKVLLFPPRIGLVSMASLRMFPIVFLMSCALILVSWRRSSGRWKVTVAPGIVYSSITLVSVGIYLIASSLIVRWAAKWGSPEVSIEAALFLILLLFLAVILLWTDFRHRVKYWIRRNLLAGNYDYRLYWLEASERVRSIDPPEAAAEALADLVQKAIGAIDISVWLRQQNPIRLKLVGTRGEIQYAAAEEVQGVIEELFEIDKPTPVDALGECAARAEMSCFLARTRASVLVPLQSGNRVVGLLTVGPDRSGRPYDWDALEFLGVLGKHAAGELHKTDLLSTLVAAKESEAFRTFSTFLLHDLKNFSSTLSLIAKNAAKHQNNPDFQRDAFQSVFQTAEKMKKLCNSLRTFSSAAPNKKLCDLNHIARAVADNFSGDLSDRLILDLGEIPLAAVDPDEIERVLRNLFLNAREAIGPAGKITLRTRRHDRKIEISVEDDGRGMSREYLEKELFVPFHTTKSEGLGIGLYQSKKIIEAHEGNIRVESREGHGTTIRLFFPVPDLQKEDKLETSATQRVIDPGISEIRSAKQEH